MGPSVKRFILVFAACAAPLAHAEIAPILLEACNLFPEAGKRMQCLRAAEQSPRANGGSTQQRSLSAAADSSSGADSPAFKQSSRRSGGGATCYTGPRGGTYTLTPSGRKNYNGC